MPVSQPTNAYTQHATTTPTVWVTAPPTITKTVTATTSYPCNPYGQPNKRAVEVDEGLTNAQRLALGLPPRAPAAARWYGGGGGWGGGGGGGASCVPTTTTVVDTVVVTSPISTVTSWTSTCEFSTTTMGEEGCWGASSDSS